MDITGVPQSKLRELYETAYKGKERTRTFFNRKSAQQSFYENGLRNPVVSWLRDNEQQWFKSADEFNNRFQRIEGIEPTNDELDQAKRIASELESIDGEVLSEKLAQEIIKQNLRVKGERIRYDINRNNYNLIRFDLGEAGEMGAWWATEKGNPSNITGFAVMRIEGEVKQIGDVDLTIDSPIFKGKLLDEMFSEQDIVLINNLTPYRRAQIEDYNNDMDVRYQRKQEIDKLREKYGITYTTKILNDLGRMLKANPNLVVKKDKFFKNKIENEWKGFKQTELDRAIETLTFFEGKEKIELKDYISKYLHGLIKFSAERRSGFEDFGLENIIGSVNSPIVITMELEPSRFFPTPIEELRDPIDQYHEDDYALGIGDAHYKYIGPPEVRYNYRFEETAGDTLGHYRSFTKDNILHVAEIQSDFISKAKDFYTGDYVRDYDFNEEIADALYPLLKETYPIPIIDEIIKDALKNTKNKKVRIATPSTASMIEFDETIGKQIDKRSIKIGQFLIIDKVDVTHRSRMFFDYDGNYYNFSIPFDDRGNNTISSR